MKLPRSSLVRQVREDLREQILGGSFPSGSQLPAEVELARAMGVSRTSLREAVQMLELDGLLIRRHGYGTFVRSSPPLQSALNINQSATELIRAHGMVAGTRDPQVRRALATPHQAERLGLLDKEPVVILERVRTADGRPVVFTRDVIPRSLLAAAAVDIEELTEEGLSLYHYFADRLGVSVADGTAWIRPDLASKELADRLGAAPGTPTLVIEQVDRDAAERPILLTWEHYLVDSFEFVIHRRGPGLKPGGARPQSVAVSVDTRSAQQSKRSGRSASPNRGNNQADSHGAEPSPDGGPSPDKKSRNDATASGRKAVGGPTRGTRVATRRKM